MAAGPEYRFFLKMREDRPPMEIDEAQARERIIDRAVEEAQNQMKKWCFNKNGSLRLPDRASIERLLCGDGMRVLLFEEFSSEDDYKLYQSPVYANARKIAGITVQDAIDGDGQTGGRKSRRKSKRRVSSKKNRRF